MQPCEVRRDERNDVLDAAGRPPPRDLGAEVIRFSRQPSLGGGALIVEFVRDAAGGGEARVITLSGHPRVNWRVQHVRRFVLPSGPYLQFADAVDAAVARRVMPPPEPEGQETRIVCMDGPGYLSERVTNGAVWSYTGSCPPNQIDPHPNEVIATLIRDMLCRRRDPAADRRYWSGRRCYAPPWTMSGPDEGGR